MVTAALAFLFAWLHAKTHTSPGILDPPAADITTEPVAAPAPTGSGATTTKAATKKVAPTVDICGIGTAPSEEGERLKFFASLKDRTDKLRQQWLDSISHSSDPATRAIGLYLGAHESIKSRLKAPPAETVRSLVQLALNTSEPLVYAIAFYTCNPTIGPWPGGACTQITADGWARLDSDNAVPWLAVAQEAREQGELETELSAYKQAAKASRVDDYSTSFFTYVEDLLPQGVNLYERDTVMSDFLMAELSVPNLAIRAAYRHCSIEAVSDPSIASECSSLGELFLSRGNRVEEMVAGEIAGERAGWPAERLAALQERLAAYNELSSWRNKKTENPYSCEVMERTYANMSELAHIGQIAMAEQRLAQSGKSLAELAEENREWVAELNRKFRAQRSN